MEREEVEMKITVNTLHKLAEEGRKITMLTCYDASFASLLDEAGVEILLVGDSLAR
ncbi:3-methyl-2-oxobutanoate hydroxymethyltransferase [Chromobacterium violaceum]|uniref:3-methyl-2-oxobutanoate hydroxymethyltransferase n=1 Tax=Chromobacterium violaceum TaxID=536 RepID=A0A3S4HL02_CHRVL|nr:3-methyl-2-oxobutanoate hydroxymethyltransferase [Chromobacterium violaceum]